MSKWQSRSRQRNLLHAHALASAPVLDERYKAEDLAELQRAMRGKIVELAVRDVVHGRQIKNLEALANPEALDHFRNRPELQRD